MSQPGADDIGAVSSSSYAASASATAQNQVLTQDIGPVVGIYDPEWSAWLAGEIA